MNKCLYLICYFSFFTQIKPSIAKLLLHQQNWAASEIISIYRQGASKLLIDSRIKPAKPPETDLQVYFHLYFVDITVY